MEQLLRLTHSERHKNNDKLSHAERFQWVDHGLHYFLFLIEIIIITISNQYQRKEKKNPRKNPIRKKVKSRGRKKERKTDSPDIHKIDLWQQPEQLHEIIV